MAGGQSRDKDGKTPEAGTPEDGKTPGTASKASATASKPSDKPLPNLSTLAARLDAAEQQNARLRRRSLWLGCLALVAVVVGALALLAPYDARLRYGLDRVLRRAEVVASHGATLEAERLVLRDRDGTVRAELAPRADGSLVLSLHDEHGSLGAELSVGTDGLGGLRLVGANGQPGLVVTPKSLRLADADGAAFLATTSIGLTAWEGGNARSGVWVGARADGSSEMSLSDGQGKTRVDLALKKDGTPILALQDRQGRTGAVVDVPEDGARLGLFSEGVARAAIGHGSGGPQLGLYGDDGKERVALRYLADGSTGVFLHDAGGRERVAIGVQASGASGLSLFDRKGTLRAGVSTVANDSPSLVLFDEGGVRRATFGLQRDGTPGLRLEDKGRPRVTLTAMSGERAGAPGPPSLVLYDKDGTILFQAPVF